MHSIKIELHPMSLFIGATVVILPLLMTSAQRPSAGSQRVTVMGSVSLQDQFDPRSAVRIVEGTSYTVPAGKLFVLTWLGASVYAEGIVEGGSLNYETELREDGVPVALNGGGRPLPPGFVSPEGSVLSVQVGIVGGGSTGVAWGYLLDA